MEPHEAVEGVEKADQVAQAHEHFVKRAAILVAALAALLAIASLFANHAMAEMILKQEQATDIWNEYQATRLKFKMDNLSAANLEILATGTPNQAAANKQASAYRKEASEKYTKESKDLRKKAEDFEAERDRAEGRHRALALAEGAFQIAIVLASVAIVTRVVWLIYISGGLGLAGLILLVNGLILVVRLP